MLPRVSFSYSFCYRHIGCFGGKLKKKEEDEKQESKEEKKQAKAKAKSKSMREQTKAWRTMQVAKTATQDMQECQEEEEEEAEEDPEVEAGETRSYNKARKFTRMLKSGQLPADIKALYDAAEKSGKPRLFRTELINRLFQKSSKGEWVLATGNQEFLSWKETQDKKFTTSQSVGMPYSILLWQTFHGNKDAMLEAQERGDIFEENGMWHFKQVNTGRTKEQHDNMKLSGGATKLSVDDYHDMGRFMKERPWSKYGEQTSDMIENASASASGARKGPAMLEDVPSSTPQLVVTKNKAEGKVLWKHVENTVNEAKGANERLQRDCGRYVQKVREGGDPALVEKVKGIMDTLAGNLKILSECQMWQEVPNTDMLRSKVEEFMGSVADSTEKANERLEEVKAISKARGL